MAWAAEGNLVRIFASSSCASPCRTSESHRCSNASDAVALLFGCKTISRNTRSLAEEETLSQYGEGNANRPCRIDNSSFSSLSFQNGGYPTSRINNITPHAHISTGRPKGSSKMVSGARNRGAPLASQLMTSQSRGSRRARPKSTSLMVPRLFGLPSAHLCVRRILSGLISRWTILFWWRYFRAWSSYSEKKKHAKISVPRRRLEVIPFEPLLRKSIAPGSSLPI